MPVISAVPIKNIAPFSTPYESDYPVAGPICFERFGFANIQPVGSAARCEMMVIFVTTGGEILQVKDQFLADLVVSITNPKDHPVVTGKENMIFVFNPDNRPDLINIWWGDRLGELKGQLTFDAYDLLLQAAPLKLVEYLKKRHSA